MAEVAAHSSVSDCWVVIHGKVLDVTAWRDVHPGGAGVFRCGQDLTPQFQAQHGDLASLEARAAVRPDKVRVLGDVEKQEEAEQAAERRDGFVEYDFSQVTRQAAPGNGNQFKTLIYLELKGAWDSAAAFVNVKTEEDVHLWCSKRPTLSGARYCECAEPGTGSDVVPGVGRYDHQRSHFEVKDAAAKGVSTAEEKSTRHGWLTKSIHAFNNLYCQWGESEADCHKTANRTRMVDGISLMKAAAGPNALEMSDTSISGGSFLHITGVTDVDSLVETDLYNYDNPFVMDADDDSMGTSPAPSNPDGMMGEEEHTGDENDDDDDMATIEGNVALEDLLDKESTTFNGIGVVKEQLVAYMDTVAARCPNFPEIAEWADEESNGEIGMQLRVVAILLANDVAPKDPHLPSSRQVTGVFRGRSQRIALSVLAFRVVTPEGVFMGGLLIRYALLEHSAVDELNKDLDAANQKKKIYPMSNTEGYLAMSHYVAGETATSWLSLWEDGDMA
eukprot:gene17204-20466_t